MISLFNRGTVSAVVLSLIPVGGAFAFDEITVTARKTAENLQEVPLAITALGEDEIARQGIKDLDKIAQQDPSVQFDEGFSPSDTRVTIRGLSPSRGRPNNATLVDGIDVGSEAVSNPGGSVLVNARLLDVARIEIVKGPQSALYGRSAFAGAIQYITKDPSDVLSGSIAVDSNSEDDREVRGSLSVPLGDTLGMLVNGYIWDERGYYRNSVTNEYIGGGDGAGVSVTFKWEPSDTVDFKWRTEYTDDETEPPAQVGLNPWNTWVDLGTNGQLQNFANTARVGPSNLAPNSTICMIGNGPDGQPNPGPGPVLSSGCLAPEQLNIYFANNQGPTYTDPNVGFTPDLGQYNPNDVGDFNQYNPQVVNTFVGKIPNAKGLQATLNPNYLFGPGATNPAAAVDYAGVDKEVFRTSLVANWQPNDNLTLTSYTGYTDANVTTQQDIGRFYADECTADVGSLELRADPTGTYGSYADAIRAQGVTNLAPFAPCNPALGPDGINDSKGGFTQDDINETTQFSQEFRANWQINDAVNFTTGILMWKEDLKLVDRNNTLVTGGPECFLFRPGPPGVAYTDASQDPNGQAFTQTDPIQDKCGNTSVVAAYWAAEAWEARGLDPTVQERNTDHLSWYGSLEWQISDKWTSRIEARLSREDNDVIAPLLTPCLNGVPANSGLPGACVTGGQPDRNVVSSGGQPTGPSTVVLCGSTGRCDTLGVAPISGSPYYGNAAGAPQDAFSWWNYGYAPMTTIQAKPPTRRDRFWTPKLTVEYYPTDDVMTYFSWSRGIKPGGYSLLTIGAFGLDPNLDGTFDEAEFEPEKLDVWELGFKSELADGKVRLNGNLFYQDFKGKQISLQKVIGNTTGIVTQNIDGSEILGVELDVTWQITDNLVSQIGYTYLDSEFTDYSQITNSNTTIAKTALKNPSVPTCQQTAVIPGSAVGNEKYGCAITFNGNRVERSPENAFLLNLTYTNSFGDTGMDWFGQANYRFQDSRFLEQYNIAELRAYSLTDIQLGLTADNWEVLMYIDNAFDDDTIRSAGPTVGIPNANFPFGLATPPSVTQTGTIVAGPNLPQDIYANMPNPRIVGIRANWRFGD